MAQQVEQQLKWVDPFSGLSIDSHKTLETIKGRSQCPKCSASRKYFCYTCIVPMPEVAANLRTISLPIKVDIIKHPKEIDGKSTAVHAAIIAPNDVTLYTYPCIPHYEDNTKILLVYPSTNAITLKELVQKLSRTSRTKTNGATQIACDRHGDTDTVPPHNECDRHSDTDTLLPEAKRIRYTESKCESSFDRVIFIDSTWNQSNQIFKDERLKDLQCIIINSKKTHFWRTQPDKPDTYLATIEAIYYYLLEYSQDVLEMDHQGRYDNLLYFFSFMYKLVQQSAAERGEKSKEKDVAKT